MLYFLIGYGITISGQFIVTFGRLWRKSMESRRWAKIHFAMMLSVEEFRVLSEQRFSHGHPRDEAAWNSAIANGERISRRAQRHQVAVLKQWWPHFLTFPRWLAWEATSRAPMRIAMQAVRMLTMYVVISGTIMGLLDLALWLAGVRLVTPPLAALGWLVGILIGLTLMDTLTYRLTKRAEANRAEPDVEVEIRRDTDDD